MRNSIFIPEDMNMSLYIGMMCQFNSQFNTINHIKKRTLFVFRYGVMNELEMTKDDEKVAVITHRLANAMRNYSSPGDDNHNNANDDNDNVSVMIRMLMMVMI